MQSSSGAVKRRLFPFHFFRPHFRTRRNYLRIVSVSFVHEDFYPIYPIMPARSYFRAVDSGITRFIKFGRSLSERPRTLITITARPRKVYNERLFYSIYIRDYCTLFHFYVVFITFIDRSAALMRITVHSTFITAIYFLIYLIHLRFQSRIILFPQSPFHFSRFGHRQSFISASYLLSYFIPAIYFNKLPR